MLSSQVAPSHDPHPAPTYLPTCTVVVRYQRACPKGVDPYPSAEGTFEEQLIDCECLAACSGSLRLGYRGHTTRPIPYDASAELVKYRLEVCSRECRDTVCGTHSLQGYFKCSVLASDYSICVRHCRACCESNDVCMEGAASWQNRRHTSAH